MRAAPPTFSDAFVVLARGRSGSSFLVDMLNRHPEIACYQELLTTAGFRFPGAETFAKFLERGSRKSPIENYFLYLRETARQQENKKRFGFKILQNHLNEWESYDFLPFFSAREVKVIYLKREDVFRMAISGIVARNQNLFNVTNEQIRRNAKVNERYQMHGDNIKKGLSLVPKDVLKAARGAKQSNKKILRMLRRNRIDSLEVSYEDLTGPRFQTLKRITDFLGVPEFASPPDSDYVKMLPKDPSSFINNIDEIRDYFRRTGNARLLAPAQAGGFGRVTDFLGLLRRGGRPA